MSTDESSSIPPGQRRELSLAADTLCDLLTQAALAIQAKDDEMAEDALRRVDEAVLYIRNGIGQYMDRVICPACRKTGSNKPAIRQGQGVVHVGFKCEHCAHEWGLE